MDTTPINKALGNLTDYGNNVAAAAQAITTAGNISNKADLWPVQNWGTPPRIILAGVPNIEKAFHFPFEQGRFTERSIGDAMYAIASKKLDLDEKIQHYLSLNRLALDGQLPDFPRAIKFAKDSIQFVQQIRTYINDIAGLLNALQANVMALVATETRMINLIQANMNALTNLLREICNWGLPDLPSLAAQLGAIWNWNGYNFSLGFNFNPSADFDFNFSFSQCSLRLPNLAVFFDSPSLSISDGLVTFSPGTLNLPLNGVYGDPDQFEDPTYIATMQETTDVPVFDPAQVTASTGTSLPNPVSIVSNYALPPTVYQQNIASVVPALNPVVIQPGDPDYTTATPSAARLAQLRSLLIRFVNLAEIVSENYEPNLTSAWIFYLSLNRAGRGGVWIENFESAYRELIVPSIEYLNAQPIPWNKVLGGTGTNNSPVKLPLVDVLKADTTGTLKWKLSYIEASLLGYPRNTTWDGGADTTFITGFTDSDLDFASTTVIAAPTVTSTLGEDTATYPVESTYPQSIAGVLAQVFTIAAADILATPTYQSTRPQFRFTYDMFAKATLVDRFSQFWRELNANLQALLTQDPYLVSFVVSYVETLNGAINPLADQTAFNWVQADVASRNRTWTPGSDLISVPTALALSGNFVTPTDATNGWASGTFDPVVFLSRPDVKVQSLPVQMAMLRTNESYAALVTLKGNLQVAVQDAVANSNLQMTAIGMPGWEVETNNVLTVPPGAVGLTMEFGQVDFDQTGYVQDPSTYVIQTTSPFILNTSIEWDSAGGVGTRTAVLLVNGVAMISASSDKDSDFPYRTQFSTLLGLNIGDVLHVQTLHSLGDSQTILPGSVFLGLLDTSATLSDTTTIPSKPGVSGTVDLISGTAFPVLTALSTHSDGKVYPIDPTSLTVGAVPFVDGIATEAALAADQTVKVGVVYGAVFDTEGSTWTVGGLIYVAAGGVLTQDYTALTANTRWIVCIGRALTATSIIYEPQIPTNYIQGF